MSTDPEDLHGEEAAWMARAGKIALIRSRLEDTVNELRLQLEIAKLRLMGGSNSTNTAIDLTPTLEETMFFAQINYGMALRRLAE